ncbi:DUF2170 family protein [Glaciecola sp. 1036]|uniref:DUF2170 family protein n=1 Tax=Alteromonadaceae TaxID=72275 RepID=UPI003D031C77
MSWTIDTINQALQDSQFYQKYLVKPELRAASLLLTFESYGDLPVILAVSDKQMLIEVALVERDEFSNPAEIDYRLLTTHKYLPLSTIAIEKINGVDWYVLFGALSTDSNLELIAEELFALVQNTFSVIDALEPHYKFNKQIPQAEQGVMK